MRKRSNRSRNRRRRQRPRIPEFAAIDLGTNSCRLLIARPEGSPCELTQQMATDFTVVDGFSRIVRLGEGVSESGQISDAAANRTIDALRVCADKIAQRHTRHFRGIATAACRRAENADAVIERIARETGLPIEVISPHREAELTLAGCTPLLNTGHDKALLFDIGGGSTEIIWVDIRRASAPRDQAKAIDVLSLPVGVVTLAERYGDETLDPSQHGEIADEIADHLASFCETNAIAEHINSNRVQMIGTSGTVTTLGALHLGLNRYDRSRIDGLDIDFANIRQLSASLSELSMAEMRTIPCIGPGRADLMLMGCALLNGICRRWPVGKLKVADRGIREGLLMEMMQDPAPPCLGENPNRIPGSVLPAAATI